MQGMDKHSGEVCGGSDGWVQSAGGIISWVSSEPPLVCGDDGQVGR